MVSSLITEPATISLPLHSCFLLKFGHVHNFYKLEPSPGCRSIFPSDGIQEKQIEERAQIRTQ